MIKKFNLTFGLNLFFLPISYNRNRITCELTNIYDEINAVVLNNEQIMTSMGVHTT